MSPKQSFWFRLGYALERAKGGPPTARRALAGLAERKPKSDRPGRSTPTRRGAAGLSTDDLIGSGAALLVAKVLDGWRPRRKTGMVRLARAGVAGAGAALLLDLIRPIVRGEAVAPIDEGTVDRLLAGFGQGLLYGAVVEPRVPGHAMVKGALFGSAEYAVHPFGGITRLLGPHAPLRRIPVLAHLFEGLDSHDRDYVEHVLFGIALALIYGSSRSSNGIRGEDDGE